MKELLSNYGDVVEHASVTKYNTYRIKGKTKN